MNPHLTARGRWIFMTAIAFLLVGAVVQQPLLILLGQVPVVLLVVTYMLCLPAALALDRRRLRLSFELAEGAATRSSHLVGDVIEGRIICENYALTGVYGLELIPFASPSLQAEGAGRRLGVGPGRRAETTMLFRPKRTGRWMLHGCDVVVTDPLGIVQSKDYLPCLHAMECYPRAGKLARAPQVRSLSNVTEEPGNQRRPRAVSAGLDVRQLRDYQPGDPMRQIAWKASARTRTLVSREYDQDVTLSTYILLDISSSMRTESDEGGKLEHAIHLCTELASAHLAVRNRVGLMTFDEKLYGHVPPVHSPANLGRLVHHLMGLSAVVDADLTELDDVEAERLLVDYLLVQERLDFRKGNGVDPATGVNRALLERWLSSVLHVEEARLGSPLFREGILQREPSLIRRFLQLRGIGVPYRVENRLGMKERGLFEAIEHLLKSTSERHHLVVVTDLCGMMNLDVLTRAIRLARARKHSLAFAVPFSPYYAETEGDVSRRYAVMRELFTTAELEERKRIAARIRSLGVPVEFLGPGDAVLLRALR